MKRIVFAAALALAFPAAATVTGNPPPAAYSCNGSTTTYTIPFPYLSTSHVVVSVTSGPLSLGSDYTISPSVAPSVGTLKLTAGSKCPNGSTLTISRNVPFTQPQSFRTGAYNGPATEQALDRAAMLAQQNAAAIAAQAAKEATDVAAAVNPTPVTVNSNSLVQPTGGTTSRTIADWLGDAQNVKGRGVFGDGSHDDTVAIQAVFTNVPASGGTVFFPPGTYNISAAVTLNRAHTRLVGYGAKIVQTGTVKGGFIVTAPWCEVEGFWLFNNNGNTDWADAPAGSTNSIGLSIGPGCDNCKVVNNRIEQWGWSAVHIYQSKYVTVSGNELIGIGATKPLVAGNNNNLGVEGYLSGIGYPGLTIVNNQIHDFAQGIYVGFDWQDVVIANNIVRDIQGQHGMYLGGAVNMVVANNTVKNTGQNGIKVQVSSDTTLNPENITIVGNTVDAATAAGIIVLPATAGLTPRFKNISIVGNTVRNSLGIDVDHADNYNIANNNISGSATTGIRTRSENGSGRVAGNIVSASQQSGLYMQARTTADLGVVENNYVIDPAQAGSGTSDLRSAMALSTGTWIARDNVMTATNPTPVASSFNVNAAAIVTLQRNRTIPNKNNTLSGTLVIDGLTSIGAANGATLFPDAQATSIYVVTSSVIGTAWTFGAPLNPTSDALLIYRIKNTSGGAQGTITWDAVFKKAAYTAPAAGNQNTITFRFDGTNWVQVGPQSPDMLN